MSTLVTPYGLKPIQMIGGQPYNGGIIREYRVAANNAAAIFNGDLVVLSAAGQPSAVTASPVAIKVPSVSADATPGIVGVSVGARYVSAATKQPLWSQFLPVGVAAAGGSDAWMLVSDDPDLLYQIKGDLPLGTFNGGVGGTGWPGAIGKNAALGFATPGSVTTGVSGMVMLVGANGAGLAATATLALRIVDVVRGTESDAYPEFIVKLNTGVHAYYNSLGV